MRCFDAHSDIWADITTWRLKGETDVFMKRHYDRLVKGGVEGALFVVWVDTRGKRDPEKATRNAFRCIRDEIRETRGFRIVTSYDEMLKARAEGVFYVLTGVEGMAYASNDPTLVRLDDYYDLGARHGMLTWNEENGFGHSAASGSAEGLTELGARAVRHMIEKRMIVDTSHLNEAGFRDIVRIMDGKPFIASHSNCRALCPHHRNLTDDQLRAIRDSGGCAGLNSYHAFIDDDPSKADIERLADHAEHMIDVMGIDHVGCGFDFYEYMGDPDDPEAYSGEDSGVPGIEDASKIPDFFDVLRKRGAGEEELAKIAYGNFHRVIREILG